MIKRAVKTTVKTKTVKPIKTTVKKETVKKESTKKTSSQPLPNFYGAFCLAIQQFRALIKKNLYTENGRNLQPALEYEGKNYSWIDVETIVLYLDGLDSHLAAKALNICKSAFDTRKAKVADKLGCNLRSDKGYSFNKKCLQFLFDNSDLLV